jgi:hypothetical protein
MAAKSVNAEYVYHLGILDPTVLEFLKRFNGYWFKVYRHEIVRKTNKYLFVTKRVIAQLFLTEETETATAAPWQSWRKVPNSWETEEDVYRERIRLNRSKMAEKATTIIEG